MFIQAISSTCVKIEVKEMESKCFWYSLCQSKVALNQQAKAMEIWISCKDIHICELLRLSKNRMDFSFNWSVRFSIYGFMVNSFPCFCKNLYFVWTCLEVCLEVITFMFHWTHSRSIFNCLAYVELCDAMIL